LFVNDGESSTRSNPSAPVKNAMAGSYSSTIDRQLVAGLLDIDDRCVLFGVRSSALQLVRRHHRECARGGEGRKHAVVGAIESPAGPRSRAGPFIARRVPPTTERVNTALTLTAGVIAREIADDLQAAIDEFAAIADTLSTRDTVEVVD
jgi:hypothetical protein